MRRHQGGFTLVELVIALTVFSFALVIALTGFITVVRIYRNSLAQRDTQVYARTIMDTIVRDAREAKSVSISYKTTPGDGGINDFCLDFGGTGERYFTHVATGSNASSDPQQYSFGKVQHDPQGIVDANGNPACAVDDPTLPLAGDLGTKQYISSSGLAGVRVLQLQINPILANAATGGTVQVGMDVIVRVAYKPGFTFFDTSTSNCTAGPGSEFCATTKLESVVTFRGGNL